MGSGNQILPGPKISGGLAVTEWYFVPFLEDLPPWPKKSTFSGIFFSNFTSSWAINTTLSNQTVLPSQTTYDYGSSETTKILGLPPMVLASGLKAQSHSGKKSPKIKFLNFASFYSARTPPPCTTDPMLVNTGTVATYFRPFLFLSQHRMPWKILDLLVWVHFPSLVFEWGPFKAWKGPWLINKPGANHASCKSRRAGLSKEVHRSKIDQRLVCQTWCSRFFGANSIFRLVLLNRKYCL